MNIIITHSDKGEQLANKLVNKGFKAEVKRAPKDYKALWETGNALVFIGALGICVREIAPFLKHKKTDPAVINIDANGEFVVPVVSGHVGGANAMAKDLSTLLNATPIITTVSDTSKLWPLDILPKQFNWKLDCGNNLTQLMASFVNGKKTALLLDIRDKGTLYLETSLPAHVQVFFTNADIKSADFEVIIAVTPFVYNFGNKVIYYRPTAIHLGLGCQRGIKYSEFFVQLNAELQNQGISPLAIASLNTAELKQDEEAFIELSKSLVLPLNAYSSELLAGYQIPNPSDKVEMVTGSTSVAEAAAMHASGNGLLLEKTKCKADDKFFTLAAAFDSNLERKGYIEFVGAGPGDPELVSVRGKRLLQTADLILYAGSLVPKELTHYAKQGCVVESSAGMDLKAQVSIMAEFYKRGLFVVRLHTGDPCIYGAIQEQMAELDKQKMKYSITPGISSFQAAAAALKSQFTIPEEVQTIILTRGEGRTPMPEFEKLDKLAASQSTMCIYLSASIAEKVQADLQVHYPDDTPVAICYKLTWKEEKIYRCTVADLAHTVRSNNLTMTTLIVVGKAIDNRSGLSKLYHENFTHAFRDKVD